MTHPLLEAARNLAPELSDRAIDAEAAKTMPPDLVEKVRATGLFHMTMPADLGGPECDPVTVFSIIEELSRADGSAGWTVMINTSAAFVAWLEPDVAKKIVAQRPDFIASSMFGPSAKARPTGDGRLVIDGRWPFNSGSPHSDWLINGCFVMDGDQPALRADGLPDWRFAFLPQTDVEILDTWNVSGLRGTGSHDVVAAGVTIPEEHTISPVLDPAKSGGAYYTMPFGSLLCVLMGGFPLGVARRAVDEFVELARTKSRSFGPGGPMVEDAAVQVEVARAEAALRSARAYMVDAMEAAWETATEGGELSMAQRADLVLGTINGARTARQVIDSVFALAGGGALYDSSPIQRCARDIAAGTAHIFFSPGRWKDVGNVQMGGQPASPLF